MRRKFIMSLFIVTCVLVLAAKMSFAESSESDNLNDEVYSQQLKDSGADKLVDELPKQTVESLRFIGVDGIDWESISKITPDRIFSQMITMAKESSPKPVKTAMSVIAIVLLTSLIDSFKLSVAQRPLNGAMSIISTLCVCTMALEPVIAFMSKASGVIKGASTFMLCYIPVMSGIMIASGQTVSATSYNVLMMSSGEIISQIASGLLTPLLNVLLAVSVISSVCQSMDLEGICSIINSFVKWGLGLVMTVFVGLLTIQSLIGNAADTASTKAAKFVISSFVPIVGGALGDAFSTVQSCVKLLKSGVGAFGIIAASFIFLPIIIECIVWIAAINVCLTVSSIFKLDKITSLLKNISRVVSTMFSILLSCMMILTISTVIVLIIGGSVL